MNKKSLKKRLALLVAMVMIVASFGSSFAASTFTDLNKAAWAAPTIQKWTGFGLINGYGDGTFKPSASITRAEFVAIAYRAFNLSSTQSYKFLDVKAGDWYYDAVSQTARLGYIKGYGDGNFKPNAPITRAEAAVVIANMYGLNADEVGAKIFADYEAIPTWARGHVGASAIAKFIAGYPDGTFMAKNYITRAEAVSMLDRAVYGANVFANSWRVVKAGVYGGTAEAPLTVKGNVYVKTADVELKNIIIEGNLVLGAEIGEGDATLNNVVVKGDTNVFGGGKNSVKINGGSYGKVFVMKQSDSPVRLLVTNVKGLDVVIPEIAANANVILEGVFDQVSVLAAGAKVTTQGNTTISEITVEKTAVNVVIQTATGTVIATVIIDVKITVLGQGRILVADVNVAGVTFEKQPEVVNDVPTTPPATGGSTGGSTPPSTKVDYIFQVQRNTDAVRGLYSNKYEPTDKLSFEILNTIFASYSTAVAIPYGFNTANEILSLKNDSNVKYVDSFAARLSAANAGSIPTLAFLKTSPELTAVLTDGPASDLEINALANALLDSSISLRNILTDLGTLYGEKEIPADKITIRVLNTSGGLDPLNNLTTANLETEINKALSVHTLAFAKGKTVMEVQLSTGGIIKFFVN